MNADVSSALPAPGQMLGRYRVEALVAEGGMGAVFRATDTALGRFVALKVMRDASAADRPRLRREAELAARLAHPGIVALFDVGEERGVPFLAMEWVDGEPLETYLRRPLPLAERLRLVSEVGEALAFAHEAGVVHRDVKPGNVLVDARGRARLLDFGIARHVAPRPDEVFRTQEGIVLGTPLYMAPEQLVTSEVTPSADQFAWGLLAYEVLEGVHARELVPRFPFSGAAPLPFRAKVSPELVAVVMRALSLHPEQRFPGMRELLSAWTHAVGGAPSPAASAPTLPQPLSLAPTLPAPIVPAFAGSAPPPAASLAPPPPLVGPERGGGTRGVLVGAALALLVALGLGAVAFHVVPRGAGLASAQPSASTAPAAASSPSVAPAPPASSTPAVASAPSASVAPVARASAPPPPPRAYSGTTPKLTGITTFKPLRTDDARKVFAREEAALRSCWAASVTEAPLHESVDFWVTLAPAGTVTSVARIGKPPLPRLDACASAVLQRTTWPTSPAGGKVRLSFYAPLP